MTQHVLPVLTVVAAGMTLVLGLQIYRGMQDERAMPPPVMKVLPQPPVAAVTAPTLDPTDRQMQILLGRPLFNPLRQPLPFEDSAGAGPTGLPRLAGTIVGPDGQVAIFMPGGDAKPIVATVGTQLGAYVVKSVQPEQVTLEGPEGLRLLWPVCVGRPPGPSGK